ncbi:MAG: endonuclease YncB(thermonuclease family), partial [Methylophagaceae bacterium]
DKYGRTVARCYLANGEEINRLMIDSGKAAEYKYFTKGFYSKK